MSDLIASIIRTAVPGLIGLIVGWLATLGITLPKDQEEGLSLLAAFVAALLWYIIVRALEQKWPALGVLLGVPKQPVYGQVIAAKHAALDGVPAPRADILAGPPADDEIDTAPAPTS